MPVFDGTAIFGDFDSFHVAPLALTTAADIDIFLGRTIGTTEYGADPGGHLYGITGQFKAQTSAAVTAQLEALQALAGIVAYFRRPTYDRFPSTIWPTPNCYFTLADLVPNPAGIQTIALNSYGLTYTMVLRQIPRR